MRVVLDTNVLISALLVETSLPATLVDAWRAGRFSLISSTTQLDEIARVTRYPWLRERLPRALAGLLVNDIRDAALVLERLPAVDVSPDPYDNYLLAMAAAGDADYLVTGDKRDLLALKKHGRARIVSVRDFAALKGMGRDD